MAAHGSDLRIIRLSATGFSNGDVVVDCPQPRASRQHHNQQPVSSPGNGELMMSSGLALTVNTMCRRLPFWTTEVSDIIFSLRCALWLRGLCCWRRRFRTLCRFRFFGLWLGLQSCCIRLLVKSVLMVLR